MEVNDESRSQNKGKVREIENNKKLMTKIQQAADIIAERGRQSKANYFITSASGVEIINRLKEEGEL